MEDTVEGQDLTVKKREAGEEVDHPDKGPEAKRRRTRSGGSSLVDKASSSSPGSPDNGSLSPDSASFKKRSRRPSGKDVAKE